MPWYRTKLSACVAADLLQYLTPLYSQLFFEMTDLQVTWLSLWVCLQYIFRFGKRRYLVWNDPIISFWNHQSVLEGHFIRHTPIFCSFNNRRHSKRLGFFFCGFYLSLPTCDYIICSESIAYKLCCS